MRIIRFAAAFLGMAGLILVPTVDSAQFALGGQTQTTVLRGDAYQTLAEIRFVLDTSQDVYAKLLPLPSNPVHDGNRANGSLDGDATGWRINFAVQSAAGETFELGSYVDDSRTPLLGLPPGQHVLRVTVWAPADAFKHADQYVVHAALGLSAPRAEASTQSGAGIDTAQAIAIPIKHTHQKAEPLPVAQNDHSGDGLFLLIAGLALAALATTSAILARKRKASQ